MQSNDMPDLPPDLPDNFPVDPRRPVTGLTWLGFWAGVVGILLYGMALKVAVYGSLLTEKRTKSPLDETTATMIAASGMVLFMLSMALIWRFRLMTLMIMAILSSALIGLIPHITKLGPIQW